jgi:hypothetical protein
VELDRIEPQRRLILAICAAFFVFQADASVRRMKEDMEYRYE